METAGGTTGDDDEHERIEDGRALRVRAKDRRGEVRPPDEQPEVARRQPQIEQQRVQEIPRLEQTPDRQDRGEQRVGQEDQDPTALPRPARPVHPE